jgi:flagellar FliL protein
MSSPTATRENRTTRASSSASGAKGGGAPDDEGAGAAPKSRRIRGLLKSKKFLIAVVGVLVIGGGAYKFAVPHPAAPPTGGEVVPIDAMTVNLSGGHYLKLAASVQLIKGKATAADFDISHASELLIDEFSNRPISAINSDAKRNKLKAQLLSSIKKAYPEEVFEVFLTQFTYQ